MEGSWFGALESSEGAGLVTDSWKSGSEATPWQTTPLGYRTSSEDSEEVLSISMRQLRL
jgi:hypothetical protein